MVSFKTQKLNGKRCRSWWDCTLSGSTLFAIVYVLVCSVDFGLFVFVRVLRASQPIRAMSSTAMSSTVYLAAFFPGHDWCSKRLTRTCAQCFRKKLTTAFLNQRKGESDRRKYFRMKLHERILRGSNLRSPDHQSEAHPTEPPRRSGFNEYLQSKFLSRNKKKKMYSSVNPRFTT